MTIKTALPTGSLEKEIMDCVWNHQEKTVRQIYLCINQKRPIAYTTVMTVMSRLVDKGLLKRRRVGKTYHYLPRISKQQALKTHLHQTLTQLMSTYGQAAVAAFAEEIDSLPSDQKQILLERLKQLD